MRLPNAAEAVIPIEKLRDYLTSTTHPVGRFKAAFFLSLGYTEENSIALETDIRSQHLSLEAEEVESSTYGRKFTITGPIRGPSGREAVVTSVWIIRRNEEIPRFATAYPGD